MTTWEPDTLHNFLLLLSHFIDLLIGKKEYKQSVEDLENILLEIIMKYSVNDKSVIGNAMLIFIDYLYRILNKFQSVRTYLISNDLVNRFP